MKNLMESGATQEVAGPQPGPVTASVTEIYPGAASQSPVVNGVRTADRAPAAPGDIAEELRPGTVAGAAKSRPAGIGRLRGLGSDVGMATAEYAIATLAAVGFAGLLVVILKSDEVRGFLMTIIRSALSLQ